MKYQKLLEYIYHAVLSQDVGVDLRTAIVDLMRAEISQGVTQLDTSMTAQQHPLGFLACRWNLGDGKTLRLHLWSRSFDWAQEPGWDIHDHIFSFSSYVLFGLLENRIYEIDESPGCASVDHSVFKVSYIGDKSCMSRIERGIFLKESVSTTESAGMFYSMEAGVLHSSSLLSSQAATVLATRADCSYQGGPRVVSAHQQESVTFDRSPTVMLNISDLLLEFSEYLVSAN